MTKITIGMPVYNGASTIRAALDSLLNQTCDDFVLVISDNGSTDETENICREYEQMDRRVRYIRQPVNLGASMNFRFVLFEAATPYFMWAAADDLWASRFLEANLVVLERTPTIVASQSKVLFTAGGLPTHISAGTYPLVHSPARNAALFFENPGDNSRYYGLFRTSALQAVFPIRNFHALDWAVSSATLRYGTHHEVPEVLMIRDTSDPRAYANAVLRDHNRLLWRVFPVLFMTKWLLLGRRVKLRPSVLYRLARLNLYMHLRYGLYRWHWLAERYLTTNSLSATFRGALMDMVGALARPGLRQRLKGAVQRIRTAVFRIGYKGWRAVPLTLEMRKTVKRYTFRMLGSKAAGLPMFEGWVVDAAPAGNGNNEWYPPPPSVLPMADWSMLAPLDGRQPVASVIVVVRNEIVSTMALIDSLAKEHGDLPFEVIIVDNGSNDVTPLVVGNFPGVVYCRVDGAQSYGDAASAGMDAASAEALFFLEQKTLVHPNFVQQMLEGLKYGTLVGPQLRYADNRLKAAGAIVAEVPHGYGRGALPSHPDYLFARNADYCPSAFGICRKTLAAAGGLSRDYETFDITALDIAVRQHFRDGRVLYFPAAVITDNSGVYSLEARDYVPPLCWIEDWSVFRERNRSFLDGLTRQNGERVRPHDRSRSRQLLYIDADTPAPDQNAGSIMAINLMRILDEQGFRVTFIPESNFVHQGKYTEHLQALGIRTIYYPHYSSVLQVLESFDGDLDIVFGCRAYIAEKYFDMIRQISPQAAIIFDTVDLHYLRLEREAKLFGSPELYKAAEAQRESELASIAKADCTIVLSTYEQEILAQELPHAKVRVIPLVSEVPDQLEAPGFMDRRDILFVGTYQHPPNHDAVLYFAAEIWPSIRKRLPDARFLVVGSSITPAVQALDGDGIEVLGFVEDLDGLLARCRLTVVPLRFGAGLKGKLVTSLQAGVPTVTSPIGMEGTTLVHEETVLIAEAPHDFANSVVRLYTDEELWQRLSQAGFDHARREYSLESNIPRLLAVLRDVGKLSELNLIEMEIAESDPLYQPSNFWRMLNERNSRAIKQNIFGFKRTINNNYYQWLPGDFNDNQVQRLMEFWTSQPSLIPLKVLSDSASGQDLDTIKGFYDDNPFNNPDYFRFYAFFVGLLWYHSVCNDPIELCERLEEPAFGDPLPIRLGSRYISQDLANSLHEWSRIRALMTAREMPEKPCILELGAGYGRLAHVFLTDQQYRYVIVDIPPALMVSKWYLSRLFPDARIFGFQHFSEYEEVAAEIEAADICFLSANQLPLLPSEFADVSVSISTLHEMRFDQIENYKALLSEKTRSVIYLKQWTTWTNPLDEIKIGREDFLLTDPWQLSLDCPHPIHDAMTELGFLRNPKIPDGGRQSQNVQDIENIKVIHT